MRKTRSYLCLLGFVLLGSVLSAHAAGFNCDQAKSSVERRICADQTLDKLDAELSTAYENTIDLADDQTALVNTQRNWLKQRNQCSDNACLARLYRNRLEELKLVKHADWKVYRDSKLSFTFEYLSNRRVTACITEPSRPCVQLMGRNMGISDYLIKFQRVDGPLGKVAEHDAVFEKNENGKWVTNAGPGMPVDAEQFSGNGWRGMQATIACGISDPETGFHAAGGDCYWAVVSNGKRSVVVDTQGLIGTDDATMHSVHSIRFEP